MKHHFNCLKPILQETFQDRKITGYFLSSLLILMIGALSSLAVPLLLKKGIDSFSTANTNTTLILISYGFLWMTSQTCIQLRALFVYRVEQRITCILGMKVLSHIYSLSQKYFLNQKSGELMNVIRKAQKDVPTIMLGIFFHALPTIFEFLCVVTLVAFLYPFIYSFILAVIFFFFFAYNLLSTKQTLKERQQANDVDKETDGIVMDWLSYQETIRVFNQTTLAQNISQRALERREASEVKFMTHLSLVDLGQTFILGASLIFLTYLIGEKVRYNVLTVGDFILFNGYLLQLIVPISILGHVAQDIKKAIADMKGILDILLTRSDIQGLPNPVLLSVKRAAIKFKNVSFFYDTLPILQDLSFNVKAGETVVIMGATGIGKSTIAKLLLRLYEPVQGQILINNIPLNLISLDSLYNLVSWVPQNCTLLNDTIESNLRLANPMAKQKDIEMALEQAALSKFIYTLPERLNTLVGNGGLRLSGGERQRLSLARIFLRKPKVCIFDEATSFLDKDTELMIQKNIEHFLPHTTKIIITHKPFMINQASKIIMLNPIKKEVFKNDLFLMSEAEYGCK